MIRCRRAHSIVFLTILLLSSISFAKGTAIRIFCNVDGAKYIIDEGKPGKEIKGVVSDDAIIVTPGQHTIKVYKDGYLPYIDGFTIKRGENLEMDAFLILYYGWVTIKSQPPGAKVIVDGAAKGQTPLRLELPKGKHTITIYKQGFSTVKRTITLAPGKSIDVSVNLATAPRAVASKKAWYKNPWIWTGVAVGVAAIAGTTTAVILSRGGSNAPPVPDAELSIW